MNNLSKFIFITFLVCILHACDIKDEVSDIRVIDITNLHKMQKIFLSDFADSIWYVPLESGPDHLLANIMFMDISERHILVSDTKACYLFNTGGKFIRQIGKHGRGPGEYSIINNLALINDRIYLHDILTSDLIEYDLDGQFLNRYKNGFTASEKILENAIMLNDSLILGNIENRTGQEKYKALVINRDGDIKTYSKNYILFNLGPGVRSVRVPGKAIYYRYKDRVYFKELLNDTLFYLTDNYDLIPAMIFEFGKYKESLADRAKEWSQVDFSSYVYLRAIFPTDNYLFLQCDFKGHFPAKRINPEVITLPSGTNFTQWYNFIGTNVLGIYNVKSGELVYSTPTSTDIHLNTSGLYNDVDAGPRFLPTINVNDSTMVMDIRFNHLLEYISSNEFKNIIPKNPEKKMELENLVNNLYNSDFGNPVLMFVTFKK